jgi:hypothetical protein
MSPLVLRLEETFQKLEKAMDVFFELKPQPNLAT